MGCMVDHIHLDKNTFSILFQKGTICSSLSIILFDSDCVHIYVITSILIHKTARVSLKLFKKMIYITPIGSLGLWLVIFQFTLLLSLI
jgi:hypothetical protein